MVTLKAICFVGFDENPDLGCYSYGTGPETRSESEIRSAALSTWLCEYLDMQLVGIGDDDNTRRLNCMQGLQNLNISEMVAF